MYITCENDKEEEGYEFGNYTFDEVPPVTVNAIKMTTVTDIDHVQPSKTFTLNIGNRRLTQLQGDCDHCKTILTKYTVNIWSLNSCYYLNI